MFFSFQLMVRVHGKNQTSSYLVCCLFSDALGLLQGAYLDFPRSREWVAVGRYCALFATFGIQAQDILLPRNPPDKVRGHVNNTRGSSART